MKSPRWALPYQTPPLANQSPHARTLRIITYIALATALLGAAANLQRQTLRNDLRAEQYQQKRAAGTLSEAERQAGPPKSTKGAFNRWRGVVDDFWAGTNIYQPHGYHPGPDEPQPLGEPSDIRMHPNMPFVVILLTPLSWLPIEWGGLVFTLLKVLAGGGAILLCTAALNHKDKRMPDWVVALGVLWWINLLVSDIQHANTNGFVLFFLALHIWLARRKSDLLSGFALAVAICLKLTPLLLVLYWVYQRQSRLVLATLGGLVIFVLLVPWALLGGPLFGLYFGTWLSSIILPGTTGGGFYPEHINQSLPGVLSRLLMTGRPEGNIFWGPDDNPYSTQETFGWIGIARLAPEVVRWIITVVRVGVLGLLAWGVGWTKLDRDDGRRGLHYAMVLCAMLLLNQRTWDHHAAYLLPAVLACWYAVAFGRLPGAHRGRRLRITALVLLLAGGVLNWGFSGEVLETVGGWIHGTEDQAERFADYVDAYGPKCGFFLLTFCCALLLSLAMKRATPPYADTRQPLRDPDPNQPEPATE
jgi:hypothetical protein